VSRGWRNQYNRSCAIDRIAFELSAKFDASDIGQRVVQQNQVGLKTTALINRGGSVARGQHLESLIS
jgi:hypothetical protein